MSGEGFSIGFQLGSLTGLAALVLGVLAFGVTKALDYNRAVVTPKAVVPKEKNVLSPTALEIILKRIRALKAAEVADKEIIVHTVMQMCRKDSIFSHVDDIALKVAIEERI